MKKFFNKNFLCFPLSVLCFFLCWILITGIFRYEVVLYSFNPLILVIGMICYGILIIIFYKKIIPKICDKKYIEYFLFVIFALLCLGFSLYFKLNPTWDMGTTFEIAYECVETGEYTNTFYLSRFPNNIMMTILDIVIMIPFKKIFGNIDFLNVITIASALSIILSVVLSFYIVKKIFNRKKAILFFIICMFTTPFYMYAAEYYTDTFSMLISTLLLYLWVYGIDYLKNNGKLKIIFFVILYGFILFFGVKLKLTSAFVFVAIIVYQISVIKYEKINAFIWKIIVSIIISCVIFIVLFNIFVEPFWAKKDLRYQNEIPIEHWIMMGMNGVGTFSYQEYDYTLSFDGYDNRKEADRRKIWERLTTRSIKEHLGNINGKLGFAWHDGTYWGPDVIRREPVKTRRLHEYILKEGNKNYYYKYFPQVMHFVMLFFIIVNIIFKIKDKKYKSQDNIMLITMLGTLVFFIIWENRSRYLVNILPFMIMNQLQGIEILANKINVKKRGRHCYLLEESFKR